LGKEEYNDGKIRQSDGRGGGEDLLKVDTLTCVGDVENALILELLQSKEGV